MVAVAPSALAPRGVTVLGATGTIGRNTLDLIARDPAAFRVEALTAQRNVDLLAAQARAHGARLAVIGDPGGYGRLRAALAGSGVAAAAGPGALVEAALRPGAEWVMAAIVGAAGLAATLAAVRRGAIVALATKECLVCAGDLFMAEVRARGATLLPVDSEHNAIFQALRGEDLARVERLILTASGGPFWRRGPEVMAHATPAEAVAHPNWRMGAKISVDSATMMNKGLELIEAHHLFGLPEERIEVLVHPQSLVHGLVEFEDGSTLAQLSRPDMRTPIAYALGWPERRPSPSPRLDLAACRELTFEPPDPERFPALALARAALRRGGAAPTVLNAANEVAVEAFLARRLGFLDIAGVVERALDAAASPWRAGGGDDMPGELGEVLAIDAEARRLTADLVAGHAAARSPAKM